MEQRTLHMRKDPSSKVHGPGDEEAPVEPAGSFLSPLGRLYIYALHGCLCEVLFTAMCDWVYTRDPRLAGYSSLWALPMYATAIYLIERLRARMLACCHPLAVRLIVYTVFIYLWELSWGLGLRTLGACPWDYSVYRLNLGGLVTLEYAMPWAVASLIAEKYVIRNALRIRLEN